MPRARATVLLLSMASASVLAVPPPPDAAPPAHIATDALVGKWYVEPSRQDGLVTDDVVTRSADRSIVIDFRICDGDKLVTYVEEGTWSVSGDLYLARTRISRTADGTPPDGTTYEERYRIETALPDRLVYRDIGTGNRFEATRVSPDFKPPAGLCTSQGGPPAPH